MRAGLAAVALHPSVCAELSAGVWLEQGLTRRAPRRSQKETGLPAAPRGYGTMLGSLV